MGIEDLLLAVACKMKILLLSALFTITTGVAYGQLLTPDQLAASHLSGYSPYFEPPGNIVAGRPLSQIPEYYRQYACTVNQRDYYEHGALFRINYETRCVTYRCEHGSYQIFREGCLDIASQKCVHVGHTWSVRCHSFLCTKTIANNVLRYEGIRNQIGCYDQLTNSCRRENELFRYMDEAGVVRDRCTCRIVPGASEIVCFSNNQRFSYVQN